MPTKRKTGEKMLRGIPVSQGVSRSRVVVLDRTRIDPAKWGILESDPAGEQDRLQASLMETRRQILAVQERLREALGAKEAQIFDAHLLVLEDPMLIEEATRFIREDLVTAEFALHKASEKYAEALGKVDDSYLSERAADIRDVAQRVLADLMDQALCTGLADLTADGTISGGMIPKVQACIDAVESGVGSAHMVDGRIPHVLLLELFTDMGIGTMVL
ncbi:MAG: phosphoenolpyruvate--protein phosphotransferase, partial [Verrucomicrobia bacterium]|nr:phosphoenolpyruvate--protein phosphotransferase [Verrucomicrobiota bacterium]